MTRAFLVFFWGHHPCPKRLASTAINGDMNIALQKKRNAEFIPRSTAI
jgi:hypothetical protein